MKLKPCNFVDESTCGMSSQVAQVVLPKIECQRVKKESAMKTLTVKIQNTEMIKTHGSVSCSQES